MSRLITVTSLSLLAIGVNWSALKTVSGQTTQDPANGDLALSRCLISLIYEAQMPAREAGQIESIEAREGLKVKAGSLLAQIDAGRPKRQMQMARLEYHSARYQSENDIDIRYAKAQRDVADAELEEALKANIQVEKAVSESEVRRRRMVVKRSILAIEQAGRDHKVADYQKEIAASKFYQAKAEIERREVRAKFDGVVTDVYLHPGEWVSPGDPICRVVRMDRLRIQGFVRRDKYSPNQLQGIPVTIEVELGDGRKEHFDSNIEFTSPEVEPGGEYRVWAEIGNRIEDGDYVVQAGMPAHMTIHVRTARLDRSRK